MDEELKALLDQAHTAGANEQQLQGIVDLYNKKKSQTQTGLPDLLTPHPSSSTADAGTSLLEHGEADLASIAKGQKPADYQPGAAPNIIQPDKPKTDRQILLEQSQKQEAQDATDAAANGGTINPYSIIGDINRGLAKGSDALATWAHAAGGNDLTGTGNTAGNLLDWATNYMRTTADANPLPNTTAGKIVSGVAGTVPTLIGAAFTGGTSAEGQLTSEIGSGIGGYLTKSEVVQQALTKAASPLTKWLGASGGFVGGTEAYKASGGKLLPTILGTTSGAQEGLESGIGLEGQMSAADKLGGSLFKLALKTGVVNEDGLITQQALKSIVAAPVVFGTASVAEDAANGRDIDWQKAGISAATALPFEAQHVIGAVGEQADLNDKKAQLDTHINNIVQATDANSIVNFATANPEDIVAAMKRPESAQQLQVLALAKGVEAQKAETYQDKNTLHLEQLQLQQQADIKSIGETVVQHGVNPFIAAVGQTELPDDIKSTLISKAHGITQEFNPVAIEQQDKQTQVADLNDKIEHIQSVPGATDPVQNPQGVTDLIDMVEKRTDLQVDLLEKSQENPDQLPNRPVLYHGSADDFNNFSPEHLGMFTNSESAKQGFFFTSSEDVANTYKRAGVIDRPNIDGLKEHLESLSENELQNLYKDTLGKYTGYTFDPDDPKSAISDLLDAAKEDKGNHILDKKFITEQIAKHESNVNRDYKAYETEGKLHQVHLTHQNPLIVDGNEAHPGELDINKIIQDAQANGHDGVIIKNIHDEALLHEKGAQYEPSNIHIVFDPKQIVKIGDTENEPEKVPEVAKVAAVKEPAPEGAFHFKSKEFGNLNIEPHDNGEYTVHLKDGTFRGTPAEIRMAVPDFDEKRIGGNEKQSDLYGTDNPQEIARMYHDKVLELKEPSNGIENAIAAYGPKTDAEKFARQDDRNNITGGIRLNYFRKEGTDQGSNNHLDNQADEINRQYFNGEPKVTEQDIVDFMKKYPGGTKAFYTASGNPELREIAQRYKDITGYDLTNKRAKQLAEKYSDVSPHEITALQEKNVSRATTEKIKHFIDDHLNKPGLTNPAETISSLEQEFDRYLADPNNEFNLFHDEYKGDILNEEEINNIRNAIAGARDDERANNTDDQQPENGTVGDAPGPQAESGERKPSEVEVEYDQNISDKKAEVKALEKQVDNKLADLSKKNDLFESTGTKKGEEAQGEMFDKTATNTEPENIRQILEPIRAKLETAKRELADLEDNREKVFEQARNQYQAELDDIPFQRGAGNEMPPERADAIQKIMEKVFPNVETIFHPTIEAFAEAAKANHIDTDDLPNAFVDKNGKINFNPESIHADTQIHEYGHILTQWAKENEPKLYQRMIAFGRDAKDIQEELRGNGYKLTNSRMAEEAFVTMLGRHGEGKLDEVIKNSGTRGTIAKFIGDIWTKFQRYLINKTGFDLSKFKNIKDMPINEFLDTINSKYLLSDTKVSDIGTKEYSQIDEQKSDRPVRKEDETMADYFKRVIDWTKEQQTGQKSADFSEDVNAKEEKPGYNFEETSIKNKVTRDERIQRDMEEIDYAGKRDFDTVWERAKQMVDSQPGDPDHIDPRQLAQNIIDRPRPLLAEQSAALAYDRMKLYNEHRQTMAAINDAKDSGDKLAEQDGRLKLATTEADIERNDTAAKVAGYEQGLGLAIRKIIAAKDYSLVHQLELAKIANGNKELTAEWRQKFETLSRQLEDAQKKLDDYQTNERARASIDKMAKLKKEAEAEKKVEKQQGRLRTQEQIDKSIETRKQKIYDILTKPTTKSNIGGPFGDAAVKLVEITPHLSGLAKDYLRKGINTFEGIVDQLHDDLKEHLEGITKRDIADALSGYGKQTKPSKDTLESQLAELKRQGRLMSALEDARNGIEPKKGSRTENEPSDRVKELQQQLKDAMKEHGVDTEVQPLTEEEANKKALDAVKTRLLNEIDKLNEQLETGVKPDKKGTVIMDQEATDLKAERDRLKAAIKETEDNKDLTDQQRIDMLLKTTQKSIEEYKQRIEDLRNTGKDTIGDERRQKAADLKDLIARTPELKAMRDRLETLQDIHKGIVDDAKPKRSREQIALDNFKARLEKKMAELQDRIDKGDYSELPKKQKLTYELDDRAKYLQSEVNRLQRNFDETRARIREEAKPGIVKAFDWFAKWRRVGFLLNPLTAIKITAGAIERVAIAPLEEAIGSGLSLIPGIDKVSAKAPREGASLSIQELASAEARVLAKTFSRNTLDETVRTFKTGKSQLEELYDPDKQKFIHPEDGIFALPGRAHGGLQAIAKQNEYHRSMEKRLAFWLKKGYDVTDPDIQHAVAIEAFKDGNPSLFNGGKTISYNEIRQAAILDSKRAAYQQDGNPISKLFNVSNLEKGNDGEQILAAIFKSTFPFTKQPINYAFEAGSYTLGAVKSLFILRNGIEKLTPEQADTVMRNFKKNGAGAAFMTLGWLLHGAIAGFWNKDEKWEDKGLQPNDVELLGVKVPHLLIDHPLFLAMEAGATARNVNDAIEKKKGSAPLANGIMDAAGGIMEHIPYTSNPITDAFSNQNTNKANRAAQAAGNLTRQIVLTPMIEQVAKWMDENKYGNYNKRVTSDKSVGETFIKSFESGIPGVRNELKKK